MPSVDAAQQRNLWLKSLSSDDFALLSPHLTRLEIERDQVLAPANKPVTSIYFPEGGIVSVVAEANDINMTEIGIFGREGLSGISALLGSDASPQRTFVQVNGSTALCVPIEAMRAALASSATMRDRLMRYLQTYLMQLSFSVVSNARHPLEARLARWLLMCHDRVDGDELTLTHEFMAVMIGAQRTGVTVTLHVLEGGGSIRSKRGRVIIIDRERLEELAGSAYGAAEAEYRKLIGDFGRTPHADAIPSALTQHI